MFRIQVSFLSYPLRLKSTTSKTAEAVSWTVWHAGMESQAILRLPFIPRQSSCRGTQSLETFLLRPRGLASYMHGAFTLKLLEGARVEAPYVHNTLPERTV